MGLPFGWWMVSGWRRGLLLGLAMLVASHIWGRAAPFDLHGVEWTQRLLMGAVVGLVAPPACLLAMAILCTVPRYLGLGRTLWALGFGGPDPGRYWERAREARDHAESLRDSHRRDPASAWQSGELRFDGNGLIDLLGGKLYGALANRDDVRVEGGVVRVGGVEVGRVEHSGEYRSTHPDGVYSGARFDELGRLMVGGRVLGAFVRGALFSGDTEAERRKAPDDIARAEQAADAAEHEAREAAQRPQASGQQPATLTQKAAFLGVIFALSIAGYSLAFTFASSGAEGATAPAEIAAQAEEPSDEAPAEVSAAAEPARSTSRPAAQATPAALDPPAAPPSAAPGAATADARDITAEIVASTAASSSLDRHPPEHAFDGNPRTAWNEASPGSGVGEWIEATLRRAVRIARLQITPGWDLVQRNGRDLFTANRYMTAFEVETDGGTRAFQVPPGVRLFDADLGGVETSRVRIVARAVQPGAAVYEDLCIGDVRIFEAPAN